MFPIRRGSCTYLGILVLFQLPDGASSLPYIDIGENYIFILFLLEISLALHL